MIPGTLSVTHQIWSALGENVSANFDVMRPVNIHMIISKAHYDFAAKRTHQDTSTK